MNTIKTEEPKASTYEAELLVAVAKNRMSRLKFPIYIGERLYHTDIDVLDLSTRGENSIKRSGIKSVGELVDYIDGPDKLLSIRGMGKKTADNIMFSLYLYQYSILPEERKGDYLFEVMRLNGMA